MVDRAPSGFATRRCCYVGIKFGGGGGGAGNKVE